ncbi:hypothetical protein K503DRAFT_696529, partial [Rhizopogon vinicolor AM-OR11-026]
NVFVDATNRLTRIINWECCGWFPMWWEYTKLCYRRDFYHQWLDLIDDVHTARLKELEVERDLWKYT